jgi:hypothetical protein
MKTEQRTTRDGRPVLTTTDAVRPLVEGVRKLAASLDRVEQRLEDARAKRAKQLEAVDDEAAPNQHGEFFERITDRRPPRTFAERVGLWRSK